MSTAFLNPPSSPASPLPIASPARRPQLMKAAPDIICFCGQDWWYHNRAHSDFQLMTRAAGQRKVLLVNSIGMRIPTPGKSSLPLRRIWRKLKSMLRSASQPLPDRPDYTVMTPILFPFYGSERARAFNAWFIRFQVERQARKLGIYQPHIIVTVPTAWEVAKDMRRSSLVYNRSDKHSEFGEADNTLIVRLERELLGQADRVLYCSRALLASEQEQTGDRARFVDHGVDTRHFASRPHTGLLTQLGCKRPIIGFFGTLDDYLIDFDLLERLAKERPNCSLVLIGDASLSMERLTRYPNVHHLGFRPYEEIPSLGADFDVAIMPWLDNAWIRHCNPIKLKEYLSLGQEIVTTYFPEIDHYADYVHVARTHDQFLAQTDQVLLGKTAAGNRQALLATASWDDRTRELLEVLDAVPASRVGKGTARAAP